MSQLHIPLYRGRPLILFLNWQHGQHGWMNAKTPDPNAVLSQQWSLREWQEFRELHYLGLVPSPFGYDISDPFAPWPGVPYAPFGISKLHSEPRLHPDDE